MVGPAFRGDGHGGHGGRSAGPTPCHHIRGSPSTTTSDTARLNEPEHEVKELWQDNEVLLAASIFFARELDPRLPW